MLLSSCRYLSSESLQEEKSRPALDDRHVEEENSTLQHTLHNLKLQLAAERSRREEAECETELTAQENSTLEERLRLLEGARRRQAELEAEVEELRQLWRSESSSTRLTDALLPDSVFFGVEERVGAGNVGGGAGGGASSGEAALQQRELRPRSSKLRISGRDTSAHASAELKR